MNDVTLRDILAEINLETLDTFSFKYQNKEVQIKLIGTVRILNSIGDWKDFVALNINTMIQIMHKDSLNSIDMSMCFPDKGVGYNINVVVCNLIMKIADVAPESSRRGRKAKSDV